MLGNIVDPHFGWIIRDQTHRHALPPGPPGAADAVNIVLIFIRDITVEHDIHIVHINPPGRHIGRNEDPKPALPETVHHLLPLFLRDIPVNALGVNPTQLQKLGDSLCGPFRIAKAHTAVKAGLQKDFLNGVSLAVIADIHAELLDVRLVLLILPNSDLLRIPLIDPGDVHHLPGDGSGKEA